NHKLGPGPVYDPATGGAAGEIHDIDDVHGKLRLLRGPKLAAVPLPKALIAGGPYDDHQQRDAVFRVSESVSRGDNLYPVLKAIHNLLDEIERVAHQEEVRFTGLKKSTADKPESAYEGNFINSESEVSKVILAAPHVQLLAGTAWLFARRELDRSLDYLLIDE